jgi:hypothetical protein
MIENFDAAAYIAFCEYEGLNENSLRVRLRIPRDIRDRLSSMARRRGINQMIFLRDALARGLMLELETRTGTLREHWTEIEEDMRKGQDF